MGKTITRVISDNPLPTDLDLEYSVHWRMFASSNSIEPLMRTDVECERNP